MIARTPSEILGDLWVILGNFYGREYLGTIDRDTRFFADMGLASIDAVVLGETLEARYGQKLPFNDLMAELGQRTDRDLRLGELVDFMHEHVLSFSG